MKHDLLKKELDPEQEIDPLGLLDQELDGEENETQIHVETTALILLSLASCAYASLDNTYDKEEFFEFDQRLRKIFECATLPYVVEPKIDGVAISLPIQKAFLMTGQWCGGIS